MWQTLPGLGTASLYAVLALTALAFSLSVVAGVSRRPAHLQAARSATYGAVGAVAFATLLLAFAFITHDFRIRYVARYSDRSMPLPYLLSALWGGQDGSLLWWSFLLSGYTGACVAWMRGRFRELQPFVLATLMSILAFFAILMLFAANPFSVVVAGARPDGEGLNPLLQNFYMAVHPPSLYVGFVGCSVPFAFAVAALVTGRLDTEWIVATRRWALFAWMFLTIGNGMGMLWAYEELGWGGYWAWDPVENAACLPWFTMTAYLHSAMVTERRGMFRVWNLALVTTSFFLTIFGTFLTRSGMIASVHSFAQSDIGTYFVGYMVFLVAVSAGLIVYRLPRLAGKGHIDSAASREAMFVLNNWALLGMGTFIAIATLFPKLSELWGDQVTVGPVFFNTWLPLPGLAVYALMGAGTVFAWRKTSPHLLKKGFLAPVFAGLLTGALHVALGPRFGFSPFVVPTSIYGGALGKTLVAIGTALPLTCSVLSGFNVAVIVQEYGKGLVGRRGAHPEEGPLTALVALVSRAKRRYGGYVVHLGVVLMMMGFSGRTWGVTKELSMQPGQSVVVEGYKITYTGPRMEVDPGKRMVFADVSVDTVSGRHVTKLSPAKFVYKKAPEAPTTEIALHPSLRDDLYVVVGMVNPATKAATLQIHVNPLVVWIWLGIVVMIFGSVVAMWPEPAKERSRVFAFARTASATFVGIIVAIFIATLPLRAMAQDTSSLHAGTVEMRSDDEREIFPMLLCQCGACARLPLSSCVCETADEERTHVRAQLSAGMKKPEILDAYAARHGSAALGVPPNRGKLRAIWILPLVGIALGGVVAWRVIKGLRGGGSPPVPPKGGGSGERDAYDDRIEEELAQLDG